MNNIQIPQELLNRMKPTDYNKNSRSPFGYQFLSLTPKELIDRVNKVVEEDELPSVAEKLNEYMEEKGLKKADIGNKVSGYMGLSTFYRMVDTKATTEAGRKTQPTREHIYQIAIAMGLSWDETDELLMIANTIRVRCKADEIYKYVIEKGESLEEAAGYFDYFGIEII